MDRRAFIAGLGAVLAAPLATEGQQAGKVYRIGALFGTPVPDLVDALRQGLRELGWIEGQNFIREILKTAFPTAERVGVLSAPQDQSQSERVAVIEQAPHSMGLQLKILEVPRADQLPGAFDEARRAGVAALMVLGAPSLFGLQEQIANLSTKARLPVISAWRKLPETGGLMSYGTSVPAMFRRAAMYVDRILKGREPWRPSGRASHHLRAGCESEDRQGPRPYDPAVAAAAGGSGD